MILKAYSVYDGAVKAFNPPFYCRAEGEARRNFIQAVTDSRSDISKHVDDYSLFWVGEFNDSDGMLVPILTPSKVLTGLEALALAGEKVTIPPNV